MVAIIGLGYVGLPLALLCAKKNISVLGYDLDINKIIQLKNNKLYIDEDYLEDWFEKGKKNIEFTNDYNDLKSENIIIVCVPTPVKENKEPDFTPVIKSMETISKILNNNDLVILESTISPGTMENIVKPILDKTGKKYHLAHCPERIDPGNKEYNVSNIPRNVGGIDKASTVMAAEFYRKVLDTTVKEMSSIKAAEATKILENSFRDTNIAFINEIATIFDSMDIDTLEVIEGAKTKPFAFMPHYPGIGVGGHCIPVDPYYLIKAAKENGIMPKFLEMAREINNNMPKYTAIKLQETINELNLKNPKIAVLGISYKQDVKDDRESPYYEFKKELENFNIKYVTYDPYFVEKSDYSTLEETLNNSDIICIVTSHSEFRNMSIPKNIKAIVDGRNILNDDYIKGLGIKYVGIGKGNKMKNIINNITKTSKNKQNVYYNYDEDKLIDGIVEETSINYNSKKYNFAVVGCGRISKRHLQAITKNPNANLYAVCDIIKEKADYAKEEYNAKKVFYNFEELLNDSNIDIVNICTPSGLHAMMSVKALKANKHVICEKPMALSIDASNKIIETIKETNKKFYVVLQNRFNKAVTKLKEAVDKNRFGKIYLANATIRWNRNQAYYDQDDWHGTIKFDGGCLMNQSIHNLDLLLWMLGDVDEVKAYTKRLNHNHEVEDVGVAVVKFKSGALAVIESTVNIYDKNLEETLSIFGTRGTAILSGIANNEIKEWQFADNLDNREEVLKDFKEDFKGDVYGFGHNGVITRMIDAIEKDTQTFTTCFDGKKSVELILGILQSSKENKTIQFPIENLKSLKNYYSDDIKYDKIELDEPPKLSEINKINKQNQNQITKKQTNFGKNVVIEENVLIGDNCIIGNNVVIRQNSIIGNNVRIDDNTVIGKNPLKSIISATTSDLKLDGTVIKDNVLIGANSVIYSGCEIGENVLIADLTSIRENVIIKEKTIIGRGVTVENYCEIGKRCKLETNVYITAYSKIEDYVFIAPGVLTSNDNFAGRTKERFKHFKGVTIRKGARIGLGAKILPGKVIGEDAFIGGGSVVTKDVPKNEVWLGSPAKYVKNVCEVELLVNQEYYENN